MMMMMMNSAQIYYFISVKVQQALMNVKESRADLDLLSPKGATLSQSCISPTV